MSPTWETTHRFTADYRKLDPAERERFRQKISLFVDCLRQGKMVGGLRVKRVQGTPDVWEMTWAPDGRATFTYGDDEVEGEPHIVWRRIGGHEIFKDA